MTEKEKNLESGRRVLRIEAEALQALSNRIDDVFNDAVNAILATRGKVVTSGLGKSGLVARKIAATMASTGTSAVFLHPVDALHGDLGALTRDDLLILISNSGENDEILNLLAAAKRIGAKCLAMTGEPGSTLAGNADLALNVGVEREACPLGLAPTASTAAAMAMGDAIAVVLMERRNFGKEDFAVFHPAGKLGRRLALKVKDIMLPRNKIPLVERNRPFAEALRVMSEVGNLGVVLVVDDEGVLCGIYTDGDIRRTVMHAKGWSLTDPISKYMTENPKTVEADAHASEAVQMMEVKGITSLAIVDEAGRPAGIIHLHDILGRGKFTI